MPRMREIEEISRARELGLTYPGAGIPDIEEIREVLGLSPEDIQPHDRYSLNGRKFPPCPDGDGYSYEIDYYS